MIKYVKLEDQIRFLEIENKPGNQETQIKRNPFVQAQIILENNGSISDRGNDPLDPLGFSNKSYIKK